MTPLSTSFCAWVMLLTGASDKRNSLHQRGPLDLVYSRMQPAWPLWPLSSTGKSGSYPFRENLFSILLVQWGPWFTEDPLNAWAWCTNDSTKLRPCGVPWTAVLFNLSVSYAEMKVGVAAVLCGQNSRMFSEIRLIFPVMNLVRLLLIWG